MPTVAFQTLGCKINQYDTEVTRAALTRAGYVAVAFDQDADVYVVNTCTVTGRSDQKCRRLVRRVCRERPSSRVIVTGCYADLRPQVFTAMGDNVVVVPNRDKDNIPAILGVASPASKSLTRFAARTRLFLKVQDGCDHECSYCVITQARGQGRSRALSDVRADVSAALAGGVREIVLAGVDLGFYGRDLTPPSSLARLVGELAGTAGDFRIRLSSVDVADVDGDLLGLLAAGAPICPHVHLPLQSADDGVLRAMRRRYRQADYRRVAEAVLEQVPDAAVGADVMAGFPGEDAAAFARTEEFLETLPFAYLHVFPYSGRPGTDADGAPGQVRPAERERRAGELRTLGAAKREEYRRRFHGAVRQVLVEDNAGGASAGVTDNYIRVRVNDYDGPGNVFIQARLRHGPEGVTATPII